MEIKHHPDGFRSAWQNDTLIANEEDGHQLRWLRLITERFRSGTIAHIGGGFGTMARILGPAYDHYIFEREQGLAQFIPCYAKGVIGDWHNTFTGTFDVVVYDLGGPVAPTDLLRLQEATKPGGLLLYLPN